MTKDYVKGPYDKVELTDSQQQAVFAQFLAYFHAPHEFREHQEEIVAKLNKMFECNKSRRTYLRMYEAKYSEAVAEAQPF